VAAQAELCATCHGAIEKPKPPRGLHAPVEAGECATCHTPHAANRKALLRNEPGTLCRDCHTDIAPASADRALVHPPARDGDCLGCHGGHTGIEPGLLQKPAVELCAKCHADVTKRSQGTAAHAPAKQGKCLECHDPHQGKNAALLVSDEKTLCARCHDAKAATFTAKHRGFQVESARCTGCHDPHGSGKKGLLAAQSHAPYADGSCDACHSGTQGLQAKAPELCTTCHSDHEKDAKKPVVHAAVTSGESCLNCHSPHGGNSKALLRRADMQKTCTACHDRKMFEGTHKHPDVQDCNTCHAPHGSANPGILVEPQASLCVTCHDVSKTHTHPYQAPAKDPRTGSAITCTSCHNPHSSAEEHLLTHEKKRALCVQCHLGPNLEVKGRAGGN
jgi:predicted CXXCH cytochrome family protein